jgi:hypothetical protein
MNNIEPSNLFGECPKCAMPAIPVILPSLGYFGLSFDCGSIGFAVGSGLAIETEACKRIAKLEAENAKLKVQLSEEYRDWMKEQCNEDCRYGERLYAEVKAENAKLRAALEQVEWVDDGCGWPHCPWCEKPMYDGLEHEPTCARQVALDRCGGVAEEKEGGANATP